MKNNDYQKHGLESSSLIRVLIQILVHLVVLFFGVSEAFASSGITYQGRLLKPNGTPVLSSVEFKLQIRTPGIEDCLLYEETVTKDLSATSGVFAISLGENPLYRTDSYSASWSMFDALSNRKAFTGFNGSDCTGVTNYTPSASDNRVFKVSFNDGTQAPGTYENLPVQAINFVPMSVESLAVGGFKASSLLRVEQAGALVNTAPLNNAQYVELLALLAGSSNQYTRDGELNGVALPAIGNNESVRWSGGAWQAFTPLVSETDPTVQAFAKSALPICGAGTVLKSDGTSLSCVADTGGWTAVDATDTVKGIVVVPLTGGLSVTGGSLSIPDQAGVTPGSYAKVTVNAKGIVTAHSALAQSDIPQLTSAGNGVDGSAISGTIGGAVIVNTTGAITTTGTLTAGTVSTGRISSSEHRVYDLDASPADNYVSIKVPASIGANYDMVLPATQGTSNQILGMNNAANGMEYKSITQGSGVTITHSAGGIQISATGSGGTVTSVTGTANQIDVDNSTPATPIVSLANLAVSPAGTYGSATQVPKVVVDAKGRVTGVTLETIAATSPVGTALAQANIWVGSSGGVAAQVPVTGDITLTDAGLTTVTSIRGNAVQSGTPSDGQVYRYDGSGSPMFKAAYLNVQDIRSLANSAISVFPNSCTSSQTMTWSALTDTFACSNISVAHTQVTGLTASNITNTPAGTIAATTVQAAINELDGDVTGLNTNKVNKNGDTMTGTLVVPSLVRAASTLPVTPAIGEIAIDSADSNKLKWYNGSGWEAASSASGTVTSIAGTANQIAVTGTATSPVIGIADLAVSPAGTFGSSNKAVTAIVDSKGRVTTMSETAITGVPAANITNTPSGAIAATDVQAAINELDGDVTGLNTNKVNKNGDTMTGPLIVPEFRRTPGTLPAGTAGDIVIDSADGNKLKWYNGSGWQTASTNVGTVASVTGTANEVVVDNTDPDNPVVGLGNLAVSPAGTYGSTTQVPKVVVDAKGRVTGVTLETIAATSPVGTALAQANIWVGSSGGVASQVPVTGDATLTDAGLITVTGIQGNAVLAGTPTDGQVYRYDGSGSPMFKPAYLNVQDIRSIANNAVSVFPSSCTSSQTMTWSALTDTFACSNISVAHTQVTGLTASNITNTPVGSIAATDVQAAINELDGDVAGLNTTKVNKNGDTMTGTLVVPSLVRTASTLPVTPAVGEIAIDSTDSNKLKWYNGSGWEAASSASGTVSSVTGTANQIAITGTANSPVIGIADLAVSPAGTFGSSNKAVTATVDSKGRVTTMSETAISGVPAANITNTPAGTIAATDVQAAINELDGDVTGKVAKNGDTMTGLLTVPEFRRTPGALPTGTAGDIVIDSADGNKLKWHDGSAWQTVATGGGTVSSVVGTANQIAVDSSTPSAPVISIADLAVSPAGTYGSTTQVPKVVVDAKGRVTGVTLETIAATSPVGSTLNSGQMWVGSVGNVAAAVSMSGDGTLSNAGGLTVTGIQGNAVLAGTPTDGQVLRWHGTNTRYEPQHLTVSDIRSAANMGISVFPSTCSASQTMTWSALTDTFACSNIAGVPAANITNTPAGTIAAIDVQAALNELDGDITGKVAKSGDTMTGTLVVPSLVRTPSGLPGLPVAGEIAIDSADANKMKWYNGSAWQVVGTSSATGDFKSDGSVAMTQPLQLAYPGTRALPTMTFAGDPDTGMYISNGGTGYRALSFSVDNSSPFSIQSSKVVVKAPLQITTSNTDGGGSVVGNYAVSLDGFTGVQTPTQSNSIQVIGMNDAAASVGAGLYVTAGGARNGSWLTDANGGDLILGSGTGTGTGSSSVLFYTSTPGSAGSTPNTADEKMRITGAGNVGIGTTAPTQKLHVVGTSGATLKIVDGNQAYGKVLTSDANGVASWQVSTGVSNIDGLSDGIATSNTLILGTTAGPGGNYNTGVGQNVFNSPSLSGNSNVAVGNNALYSNTSASNNVALGSSSMDSTTTGGSNTAVGSMTLRSNTTGGANTAVGYSSLYFKTSGGSNTAIGYRALYTTTDGSGNTAVGSNAGFEVTSGSGVGNNTLIGAEAGRGITTGINNTILGANVTGLPSNLSNNIIIADGSGNRRINVDSSGNIGIGTTTPNSKLTVEGGMTLGQLALDPVGTAGYGSIYAKNDGKLYFRDGVGAITDLTAPNGLGDIVNGGNTGAVTVGTNDATPLTLETNNTPRMTVLSDGNVGIGTTSPVQKAEISIPYYNLPSTSGSAADGALRLQYSNTALDFGINAGWGGWLQARNPTDYSTTSGIYLNPSGGDVGVGNTLPSFAIGSPLNTANGVFGVSGDSTSSSSSYGIIALINNYSAPTAGTTLGDIRFSSPSQLGGSLNRNGVMLKSSLEGSGGGNGYGANFSIHTKPDNTSGVVERFRINSSGNVGIGTTSPAVSEALAVEWTGTKGVRIGPAPNDGSATLFINAAATTQRPLVVRGIASQTANLLSVENSASTSLFNINATGNVGIGTSTPGALLDVNGNVRIGSQTTRSTASNRGQLGLGSTYTQTQASAVTVNWDNGNIQEVNTFLCNGTNTITMSNVRDGAAYTLLLTGTAAHSGACVFSSGALSFKASGGNVAPTASKDVLFTFVVINNTVVYSMVDNLQ